MREERGRERARFTRRELDTWLGAPLTVFPIDAISVWECSAAPDSPYSSWDFLKPREPGLSRAGAGRHRHAGPSGKENSAIDSGCMVTL